MSKTFHVVNALVPSADALSATAYTDVINMKNYGHITFILQCGDGDTGTSTITVEACDDTTPTNTEAIEFTYQECVEDDIFGEVQKALTTGFTTKAAANKVYKIYVDSKALASSGYGYIRLKAVEVVDDPVTAGVIAILTQGRFKQEIYDTALE